MSFIFVPQNICIYDNNVGGRSVSSGSRHCNSLSDFLCIFRWVNKISNDISIATFIIKISNSYWLAYSLR